MLCWTTPKWIFESLLRPQRCQMAVWSISYMSFWVWGSSSRDGCRDANSGQKTNYFYDFQAEFGAVYAKSNGVLGSIHYHRYISTHQSPYNSLKKGFSGWKSSEASRYATMGGKGCGVRFLGCTWSNIHWLSWKGLINNWHILFIIIGSFGNSNCRKTAAFEDEKKSLLPRHCTCSFIIIHHSKLHEIVFELVSQPTYSIDLTPRDFYTFSNMKK